jgi:uncharacterized protein (TIGR02001 family)
MCSLPDRDWPSMADSSWATGVHTFYAVKHTSRVQYDASMLRVGILSLAVSVLGLSRSQAADFWGGSIAFTSDYLVRGISRSNGDPAVQADVHYLNDSGFIAGLFASNTHIDPYQRSDVEFDAFGGFGWIAGEDWRGKALLSYYSYPFNADGSEYNYVEADLELEYRQWLDFAVVYSPDAPRFFAARGLAGVASESVEVNAQRLLVQRLSGTAGLGFSHYAGPEGTGYLYWSLGVAYDLRPVALAVAYSDTSAEAKSLFYNNAVHGRWIGTVIWRF